MKRLAVGVLLVALTGCGSNGDSMTIELREVNGSGVSGAIKLERVGERSTRITVLDVEGGAVTGARVVPGRCKPNGGLDDKYPITAPTGVVRMNYAELSEWDEDHPVAGAFMNRGRYVACGER
jgi:hypothetical protein